MLWCAVGLALQVVGSMPVLLKVVCLFTVLYGCMCSLSGCTFVLRLVGAS